MTDDEFGFEPPRKKSKLPCILLVGCGLPVALVVVIVATLGVLIATGRVPDTAVVRGPDVSARMVERMHEIEVLEGDDELILFYSWGFIDSAEGGSALTNRGVVTWYEEGDRHVIEHIPYAEIQGAEIIDEGSYLVDAEIRVETEDFYHTAVVSNEEGGHELFLETLLAEWERRGGWQPHEPEPIDEEIPEEDAGGR